MTIAYPDGVSKNLQTQLDLVWKRLCLNQFHDIVCGTAATVVFDDARKDFDFIMAENTRLLDQALSKLTTPGDSIVLFNPAPTNVSAPVLLPAGAGPQRVKGGSLGWADLPGYGIGSARTAPCTVGASESASGWILENSMIRATIDSESRLTSVHDKLLQRDLFEPGQDGNQL